MLLTQQYIEKWNGSYGEGNVFSSEQLTLLKNVGKR